MPDHLRYTPLPSSFYKKNRKKLIEKLLPDSVALIVANELIISKGDQFYPFVQDSNFFYLTGLEIEKAILALCPHHPSSEYREVLFIPSSNEKSARWKGKPITNEEIYNFSAIEKIIPLEHFKTYFKEMINHTRHIYMDLNSFIEEDQSYSPTLRLLKYVQSNCPFHKLESLKPYLTEMRLIKSEEEIEQIKRAIEITEEAFLDLVPFIKPGLYEYEIEAQVLASFLRLGADGYAFHPIVASGNNANILHYCYNRSKLKENELLLIDIGASYGNYCADITRTLPISGHFTERQLECYEVVLKTLEFASSLFKPGNTIEQVNKEVLRFLEKPLLDLKLISTDNLKNDREKVVQEFFMHGVSHFVGLEVHDVGNKHIPFQPGMILTCEPGLYIDSENMGIRLENMFLITYHSPIVLTSRLPLNPNEIEKLMS
ncbi:MAG: aminopeptidase P N-terminal domain-containing protein [Bacteroidales bacterium]|nr:aminopeptidase P N-terminal domain-containing protein [Bacteroidales bacterium]